MLSKEDIKTLEGKLIKQVTVNKIKTCLKIEGDGFLVINSNGYVEFFRDALRGFMNIRTYYPDNGNKYYDEAEEASEGFSKGVYELQMWELANIMNIDEKSILLPLRESQYMFVGNNPFKLLRRIKLPVNPHSAMIAWLKDIKCTPEQVDFDNMMYGGEKVHLFSYENFKELLSRSYLGGK